MILNYIDWIVIALFFTGLLTVGMLAARGAGKNFTQFFLSGRNMPWWLLGVSMVATTFSCDTPNLVTDMVRTGGVAANWLWWAFLLTGMLTVFLYAKLWNRSKAMTDLEFYEIRYSGKTAAFLRGFRAVYLGFFFNVMVIASVSLAFIKIAAVMLGLSTTLALIIASVIVVFYSGLGGLKSILYTDFYQFSIAMAGAIIAAVYVILNPQVGGLSALFSHPAVSDKLSLIPSLTPTDIFLTMFIVPLAVQWWAAWYPGAEPGGGGYVVQRLLSARNEKHAMGATLLFNFFHYAIRPWPWILVGLASLIVFPDISSMMRAYPEVSAQYVQNDFAYPAMLARFLPAGVLGMVVASLIAAFLSTVASQLNWGSSYLANDFYVRFINPKASEKQKVTAGRLATVALMFFSVLLALVLKNALQAFQYMLMIGAGTGLIYILRWFWWRINAFSELAAMLGAAFFSLVFLMLENYLVMPAASQGTISILGIQTTMAYWNVFKFTGIVVLTTISWLVTTFLTRPVDDHTLENFYSLIRPGGPGWKAVVDKAGKKGSPLLNNASLDWDVPTGILCMLLGAMAIYGLLFSIGSFLYGFYGRTLILVVITIVATLLLFRYSKKLRTG